MPNLGGDAPTGNYDSGEAGNQSGDGPSVVSSSLVCSRSSWCGFVGGGIAVAHGVGVVTVVVGGGVFVLVLAPP